MPTRLTLLIAFVFTVRAVPGAVEWQSVTTAELALKTPKIDLSADAEAIFWDVRIDDRLQGGVKTLAEEHYIRIKIFTDRGKQQYSTVEIPVQEYEAISEVAARTIKPGGVVIDLKKDSIFDRDTLKTRGRKLRTKNLALPNVEVGDIIEYHYKEVHDYAWASHMRLYFQREIPIWRVTYHVKPIGSLLMRSMSFSQINNIPFEKEANGFFSRSATNVPAFQHEPDMPPEDQLLSWLLVYYEPESESKVSVDKFWKDFSKQSYTQLKPRMKADNLVKSTAREVTSAAEDPMEKLALLDWFCRSKIRNTRSSHMTGEEKKTIKENSSPHDTLKQMAGTGEDIDLLFAALANAAGFDARFALLADRGKIFFTWNHPNGYYLTNHDAAVKVGDKWTFFDPATPYLERGMLRWEEEGQQALLLDPEEFVLASTPFLAPNRSLTERRASLKLLDDGTLQGTVTYSQTGHAARERRLVYDDLGPAQQEEAWKEEVQARLALAEISDFRVRNLGESVAPLIVSHKISVPGYAVRTGKRILVQPAFFQRNLGPRYTSATRKWDLYYKYAWIEDDEITLELPDGWELDEPIAPNSSKLGTVGHYTVELLKSKDGRKLIYRRKFEWGQNQAILLPVSAYPQIKSIFEWDAAAGRPHHHAEAGKGG